MRWAVAVLVAGIVAASSTRGDDESKNDLAKLEGTWKIASIEVAGKKVGAPKGAPDEVGSRGLCRGDCRGVEHSRR